MRPSPCSRRFGINPDPKRRTDNEITDDRTLTTNSVVNGDCIEVMRSLPWASVDFILTDPPYLVNYRDRSGRSVRTSRQRRVAETRVPADAPRPEARQPVRFVLRLEQGRPVHGRPGARQGSRSSATSSSASATARTRGSSATGTRSAYLLAKGRPPLPAPPVPDVLDWQYSGNRLHPTQKPVAAAQDSDRRIHQARRRRPRSVLRFGLDPVAARELGRQFIGIELDETHCRTARDRLAGTSGKHSRLAVPCQSPFNRPAPSSRMTLTDTKATLSAILLV